MTGYGRGAASLDGMEAQVEMTSVNRKQLDITFVLPRELAEFEPALREMIAATFSRGRITVSGSLRQLGTNTVVVNEEAARRGLEQLRRLQRKLNLPGEISFETLLSLPGVVRSEGSPVLSSAGKKALLAATQAALRELAAMRDREGAALRRDLLKRTANLGRTVKKIRRIAPAALRRHRNNLEKKLREANLPFDLNDERVQREIVLFADRCDITEELTRMESHLAQFVDKSSQNGEPVGRTLEFLCQEMGRELNTIASKASDADISQLAVEAKAELERMREQLANVE